MTDGASRMDEETITFTSRYSRAKCLTAAWRFWQRRMGRRYLLEVVIGAGLIVFAAQGPYRWLEVALWIAVGLFTVLGAGVFVLHWTRALAGLAALDPPESTWLLSERFIGQRSNLGETAIGWEQLHEAWVFPEVWLLFWGRDVYSAIPTDSLPSEAQQLIRRRLKETGGRVR